MRHRHATVLLLCCSVSAFAQCCPGEFRGRITSDAGTVIPNASITLHCVARNPAEQNLDITVRSGADGTYGGVRLPWEPCNVQITAAGFQTAHRTITPMIDANITLDVVLQPIQK